MHFAHKMKYYKHQDLVYFEQMKEKTRAELM